MTRAQRNWMIGLGANYAEIWRDPALRLRQQAQAQFSQSIRDGMEAAPRAGRPIGRPRIVH
jgi:hypothetical protein